MRHNAAAAPGRHEFARLLRAEFTKFRTVPAWIITLGAAAIGFVFLSFASASVSHANNPPVPTGPSGEAVTDNYTLVHQTLAGDGTVTVRVASLAGAYTAPSNTSDSNPSGNAFRVPAQGHPSSQMRPGLAPWAKAGIILEPDTNQGTRYAAVMATGSHGARMQHDYTHDSPGLAGTIGPSSPRWLRLTRTADAITGYDSTDGAHWTTIDSIRLTGLPHTVQIGLFVTSPLYFAAGASNGTPSVATATFDQITTQGELPERSWTADAIGGSYPYLPSASTWQQRDANAFTISGSGDIAPLVGGEDAATHWAGASIVNGTIAALLIVIVLAALFTTAEYRRGLIRTALTACPRRGRVLAAKATVAGSLAGAAGTVATAIAEVITRRVLAANGNYLFPQSGPAVARVIIGTGLLLALAATLVVALGTILRHGGGTVVAGIMLLVVPGILGSGTGNWLMRLTPTAAFAIQATLPRYNLVTGAYTPPNGYFPISPWAGLAVLAVYTAAALATAMWLLPRRDA